mgnify:CR=1 FL=1
MITYFLDRCKFLKGSFIVKSKAGIWNKSKKLKRILCKLNNCLIMQNDKVAYLYKNLRTGEVLSLNEDVMFYAASIIKLLMAFYIYKKAEDDSRLLDLELEVIDSDLKRGSGIIRDNNKGVYTIRELVKLSIKESDNTAYIKLVNYFGSDDLISFGCSLGARHTLEGKDLFGCINCSDMLIYLEALYNYFLSATTLALELKSFMVSPSYEIIDIKVFSNYEFVRKYGSFEIAYHEVGIVYSESPFIVIILTQKNKLDEKVKKKFVNKIAKIIYKIHNAI